MPSTLSATARAAVFAQDSGEIAVPLLTLTSPSLNGGVPLRLCAWREPITSRGMLFDPYPFAVTLPEDTDDRPPKAMIELDNISTEAAVWMRSIDQPVKVKLEIVLRSTPDVVEFATPIMEAMTAVFSASSGKISVPISIYPYGKLQCPHRAFTPNLFPGLF